MIDNSDRPIIVVGAGGHSWVVVDALLAAGRRVIGVTDPSVRQWGSRVCGIEVLGGDEVLTRYSWRDVDLANGVGGVRDTKVRRAVQQRLTEEGWQFTIVRHPRATVSEYASLGAGAQLFANSVVQAGAQVGVGCILNTASVIEHHAHVGDYAHIAPCALLCGYVVVGAGTHVGAGATLRQGVRVGSNVVIGAGAAVVADFEGPGLLIGVPARLQGGRP